MADSKASGLEVPAGRTPAGRPRTRVLSAEQEVAARIVARRKQLGLKPIDIANRLGIASPRYRNWETHFGGLPMRQYGEALCRILCVSEDWLHGGEGELNDVHVSEIASSGPASPCKTLSSQVRESLGRRMKQRRREIGLSSTQLAARVSVSVATIRNWESELPAKHSGEREDRLEDILCLPRGSLRNPDAPLPPIERITTSVVLSAAGCVTVADEIRAVGVWLAHSSPFRRTIYRDELPEGHRRLADYFAERYGVVGEDLSILASIGSRYNLTRERIRQVQAKMSERAAWVKFITPTIDSLEQAIAAAVPITVKQFDNDHRDLLGEQLSVESAIRFAREILGRGIGKLADLPSGPVGDDFQNILVDSNEALSSARAIREAARKMIRSCGAAHILFVTGAASEIVRHGITVDETRKTVMYLKNFEWLAEDANWFWLGHELPNRALTVVRKMLAVAGRKIDVDVLHSGVCRSRRVLYDEDRDAPYPIEVPWPVLREMLTRTPWLVTIQKNDFQLVEDISPETVLPSNELPIYNMMKEHGGILAANVLLNRLVKTGRMGSIGLQMALSRSAAFHQHEFGIHAITGYPFNHDALRRAQELVGGVRPNGATTDENGWVNFDQTLTQYQFVHLSFDLPTGVSRVIPPGEYKLQGVLSGSVIFGKTPSAPTRITRLTSALKRVGCKPGDEIHFRVHGQEKIMVISISSGDETPILPSVP